MSRRPRRQALDQFQQAYQLLELTSEYPPNRAICAELKAGLDVVQAAARHGNFGADEAAGFVSMLNSVLVALPQTYGKRFLFDSAMIGAIKQSWDGGGQRLSSTILPRHGAAEWMHGRIRMPTRRIENNDLLSFIIFPDGDDLNDVDLLDYSFLCHELGHNLLNYDEAAFVSAFGRQLNKLTGALALAGVADRGKARAKAQGVVDEIRRVWTPAESHEDWAHEMMMDLIALWTCGPAYLASFAYEATDPSKNPYHVSQEHPPYALRAEALVAAGRELGWSEQTRQLREQLEGWRSSAWKGRLTNNYVKLADSKITRACISCTLAACEEISLPRCDGIQLGRLGELIGSGGIPDFGTDAIVAAWLVRQGSDDQTYRLWERGVVDALFYRIVEQSASPPADS